MSVKHIGLVLDGFKTKNAALKLVAIILADHADADGVCWPSMRRIAARANIHERSAQRHIKELQALGIITKTRNGTIISENGKAFHVTNAYQFNDESLVQKAPKLSTIEAVDKDTSVTLEGDTGVVSRVTAVSSKSSINHQRINHQLLTPVEKRAAYRQAKREPTALGGVFDEVLGGL